MTRAWAVRALPAYPVSACRPGGSSTDWDSCGLSHRCYSGWRTGKPLGALSPQKNAGWAGAAWPRKFSRPYGRSNIADSNLPLFFFFLSFFLSPIKGKKKRQEIGAEVTTLFTEEDFKNSL